MLTPAENKTLNKIELLIRAVGDRHQVEAEPSVYQRGIGAAEIVAKVQIAFELVLLPQRRILAVSPALHWRSHDKRHLHRHRGPEVLFDV